MTPTQFKYLRPEDLVRLRNFEFAPKMLAEGYMAGRHRSKQRGSSVEFHDYRQFVFGDDPALIDWRVFGRTDRHYLRIHEQETNLEVHIFLDSSASMGFAGNNGGISKLDYMSFFAAALACLVTRNRDRVSLQIFDDKIREFFPLGSTRRHLFNMLSALEINTPGNETSLGQALRKSNHLLRSRGTLIILSDFLDEPESIFHGLSPFIHRGFRIFLFQILTPEELELPYDRLFTFRDSETRQKLIAHPATIRAKYREAVRAHIAGLRELSRRRGIEHALVKTDTHYFDLFDKLQTG